MPQSSWTAVVARVKAQMQGIAGIGNVHDQLRQADDADVFAATVLAEIGGEKRLRSWYISLGQMRSRPGDSGGHVDWTRDIEIEGFLQFEDGVGSEKTTLALAESIIRTINADIRTTKLGGTILSGQPASILDAQPREFAGVVCAYVKIMVPVFTVESP